VNELEHRVKMLKQRVKMLESLLEEEVSSRLCRCIQFLAHTRDRRVTVVRMG
jgi:hypothetical protein